MDTRVKEIISDAPVASGVYLFKNSQGQVIYVGKALKLKDRLKSYLQYKKSEDPKLRRLGANISDLEIIKTNNEIEALLLESNLIKKYKPRYNILLKDDKAYPYIKINVDKKWPFLEIARKVYNDGSIYLGPYTSAKALRSLVAVINKAFPLRKCSDTVLRTAKRPCINYQMGNCVAPCSGKIDREQYMGVVNAVISVLKGKTDLVIEQLEKEMLMASDNLAFEDATKIRERIKVLETLYKGQSVVMSNDLRDIDLISISEYESFCVFNILFIRNGMLLGQYNCVVEGDGTKHDALNRFLVDYYIRNIIPDVIIIPFELEDDAVKEYMKSNSFGKKILVTTKLTPELRRLKKIGRSNLEEFVRNLRDKKDRWDSIASELSKIPNIGSKKISSIECYDMSNTSGKFTVGAKVFYMEGMPVKNNYRKYKIKSDCRGDDIKAMTEVLERRLAKIIEEPLPDLIIIDGGKTQLNAVVKTFRTLNIDNCPIIAIAKDKELSKGLSKDKLYMYDKDGQIIKLNVKDSLLNFVKMIRDEAHRFVIGYHRKLRDNTD